MKMSFIPGDLHLTLGEDGVYVVRLKGNEVHRSSAVRRSVHVFNKLRLELAAQFPKTPSTAEERRARLKAEIADRLVDHNSFRPPQKKKRPGSTRTFG